MQFGTEGRITAIKKLLPIINQAGIDKPIIDTFVLDIPSFGMASRAMFDIKNELGLVVGCGAHNAITTWKGLKTKMGKHAKNPCIASTMAVTAAVGGDFILYGPIKDAKYVFPSVSMIDAAYAQVLRERRESISRDHPLFKIA